VHLRDFGSTQGQQVLLRRSNQSSSRIESRRERRAGLAKEVNNLSKKSVRHASAKA
jgi:hypothetical protein